jgi:FtsH-binding integral membrane protein
MFATIASVANTNRVLRNTFTLLALTLIPTIAGTWAGFAMGIPAIMHASPWLSFFGFLAITMALLAVIHVTADDGFVALAPLFGFTFVIGASMTGLLGAVLALPNGHNLIMMAFLGTMAILAGCSGYAMTTKRDFSAMGGFLFSALLGIIVLMVVNMFFQFTWLFVALAGVSMLVFSAFLVFDVQQVVNGGETNYIRATVSIYLDLVNIFQDILSLLGIFGGDD